MMAAGGEDTKVFYVNVCGSLIRGTGRTAEEAKEDAVEMFRFMLYTARESDSTFYSAEQSDLSYRSCTLPQLWATSPLHHTHLGIIEPPEGCAPTVCVCSPFTCRTIQQNTVNYIRQLQEFCHAQSWPLPEYTLIRMDGPSHSPCFTMKCEVLGYAAIGFGRNKKDAKHHAANMVYSQVNNYEYELMMTRSQSPSIHHPFRPKNTAKVTSESKPFIWNVDLSEPVKKKKKKAAAWKILKVDGAAGSHTVTGMEETPECKPFIWNVDLHEIVDEETGMDWKSDNLDESGEETYPPASVILCGEGSQQITCYEKQLQQRKDKSDAEELKELENIVCSHLQNLLISDDEC